MIIIYMNYHYLITTLILFNRRILLKRQDTEYHNICHTIAACFILHNICINHNDTSLITWRENIENNYLLNNDEINYDDGDNDERNGNVMRRFITNVIQDNSNNI